MDDKQILKDLVNGLKKNYGELLYPKKKDGKPINSFSKTPYVKFTEEKRCKLNIEIVKDWQKGINNNIKSLKDWEIFDQKNELKEEIFYKDKLGYEIICKTPGKKKWTKTGESAQRIFDFKPELNGNGVPGHVLSMSEFFYPFFNKSKSNELMVNILYVLFFRLAFMLDHVKDKNGKIRLKYSKNIEKYLIQNKIETELKIKGFKKLVSLPLIVYLHCVETFLMADDVYMFTHSNDWKKNKASRKVYDPSNAIKKKNYRQWPNGRINTALTFCNVIRCSLDGNISLMPELLEQMAIKRGMSQISKKEFIERLEIL